jgi:hypothetical protein
MLRYLFIFVLFIAVRISVADDDNDIGDTLENAKSIYSDTVSKAKEDLLAAFDFAVQDVAKTGNLDGVKAILAEKKAFEAEDKLPTSQLLKKAAVDFKTSNDKARKTMTAAYDAAISSYTKALQIEKADAVKDELETFKKPSLIVQPVTPVGEKLKKPLTDNFTSGSEWTGAWIIFKPTRGAGDFRIIVTERVGDTFKGELHCNQEGDLEYIAGTVNGDQIEWRFTKVLRTNRPQLSANGDIFKGTIKGDYICVLFQNEPADGLPKQTGMYLLKMLKQ